MFLLIRIFAPFADAPGVFASGANDVAADIAIALGAHGIFGNAAPAAIDVPALAETARAVRILEFDTMMIENLTIVRPFAHFATAHAIRPNRWTFLDPVD